MKRRGPPRAAALSACVALTVLAGLAPPAAAALSLPPGFANELVVSGLGVPRDLDFLPSGDILVMENDGVLKVVESGTPRVLLDIQSQVKVSGEQGFLGLAIDPDFPARPYVYFHYSADETPGHTRLSRFTFVNASGPGPIGVDAGSELVLIGDIPDDAFNHNGGTVRFGPDKRLYMSLGEDADPCDAQDITLLKGKILRVNVNASANPANRSTLVPPDNPYASHPDVNARLVYAYGLRNPFRFDIDRQTGVLYIGDVGQSAWEELDEAHGGENFGWPYYEGLHPYRNRTTSPCAADDGSNLTMPIKEYGRGGSAAIIMSTVYHGVDYPNDSSFPPRFEGALFHHDFYSGELRVVAYNQTNASWDTVPGATAAEFGTGLTGVPSTRVGPDGALYFVDAYQGELRRIVHTPAPEIISQPALPPATVGVPYAFQLVAQGGTAPYAWSVALGALPPGLSVNATSGKVEGTPNATGDFAFRVRVTDNRGATATQNVTVGVRNPVAIAPVTYLPAFENESFLAALSASGGRLPYLWEQSAGTMPPGVTLQASTGLVAGTPTAPGTFNFTVRLRDADGRNASIALTVTVNASLRIATTSLADGELFVAYVQPLNATGGAPPYAWSVAAGALPPGVNLTGASLEGTPLEAGVFQVTLRVTDARSRFATRMMDLVVQPAAGAPPFISVTFAPNTTLGDPYAWNITAAGGYGPFVFSLLAGGLPPGISLAPDGTLTGVSSQAGQYAFTVQVSDTWNQTANASFTVEVLAPPHWIELLPVGEVYALAGAQMAPITIHWRGENVVLPLDWKAAGLPAGLSVDQTGNITGTPAAIGNFTVTVTVTASEPSGSSAPVEAEVSFLVRVPGVDVEPRVLPTFQVGVPASEELVLPDANYALTYTVASGALPPGMQLTADGKLEGTPTEAGNFSFTLRAAGPGVEENHEDVAFTAMVNPGAEPPDGSGGGPAGPSETVWYVLLGVLLLSVGAFLLSRRAIRRQQR